MTMKVMPDRIFDGHMKLDALLPDKRWSHRHHSCRWGIRTRVGSMQIRTFPYPSRIFRLDVAPVPTSVQLDASPPAGPAEVAGTGAVPQIPSTALQYRAVRSADDYYPSQSLSLQEEGAAIVRVCVSPAGRLDGKPVIETTSGSPRLDAAALMWAREALRFTPATQGGIPVAACKGFRVVFNLH